MQDPLKIILALEPSGGGSGRHVLDLAEGLAQQGQSVTVIWSPVRAQSDFRERLFGLEGVANLPLDMNRAVGKADLKSLRALTALLREHGPFDVLHGHSSKAGALMRLLPRSVPGCRIYTSHAFRTMDPTLGSPGKQIYGLIERVLATRADRIITVSAAEKTHGQELGIDPKKLVTIINGASLPQDATRNSARALMGLEPEDIAIGFIGRLDHQKAPLRFVQAVSQAVQQSPAIKGIVIGDGEMRDSAEAANTQGAVKFMGWQNGPALFPGLDVFCMTSYYEAMPYTLLEALHAGIPIVTTAVGGVEETVQEDENGFVLPTDCTPEALSERLVILANDAEKRAAFGASSHHLAQDRTVENMVSQTLQLYRSACAS